MTLALLFVLVLTMISGARELMTPRMTEPAGTTFANNVTLADVAGKGVAAALYFVMAFLVLGVRRRGDADP